MTVRAYDIYGLEFDQDQYKAMNFAVQAEMTAMRSANDIVITQQVGAAHLTRMMGREVIPLQAALFSSLNSSL